MISNIFDRFSFLSIFLVIVLLPFFFLPATNIPIETSKGALLVLGLVFSVIFWGFARFFEGKISLPRSGSLLGGAAVVLVFLVSAIFLKVPQVSLFGTMFDIGSFWFIFAGFILMLMSSIILGNPKVARVVLFGAILSSAVLLIFQSVRLFLPQFLSLGILTGKTDNLLGSWNALGIFAGFSALMSLFVIEFFSTTRIEKWVLRVFVILSMVLVATVNFRFVWGILGIFALIIFVYKISISKSEQAGEEKKHFPAFSFTIIIVALLFFILGSSIGGIIPSRLGLENGEVSPSFGSTMGVTKSVLKENPILGIGPNKFGSAWAMYKPKEINSTAFWDVYFNSGSGLLPTLVSTTGYLGILAFLVFLILFLAAGARSIFSDIKNGVNWETTAFFLLSLYLFVSCFFYSAGAVVFLLALAFAGVFIGLSASSKMNGAISLSFKNDHRKSFPLMLFIVFIIIFSVAASFKYTERLVSVSYFRKALTASTIPVAETYINKALRLSTNDLYLRTSAQVYLVKLNSLVQKGTALSDADKALLQPTLDQAVNGAERAIIYDPTSYLNFQALGSLYQSVAALGVKDAYGKGVEAYKTAANLNPKNPRLKLSMAILSFADKKAAAAKDYGNEALLLKPDYIDALIILSQIAHSEGDDALALSYAQRALSFSPTNADLIKYVESLKNPVIITPAPTVKKP